MADNTHIEWTDATWNPITGCSITSPGCKNCYAMQLAGTRLKDHPTRCGLTHEVNGNHVWTGEVRFNEKQLLEPLKWAKPRMIFVCAHGDLFHESVPDDWIDRVFAVMALCPQHTFQVLTKRADRMKHYMGGGYEAEPRVALQVCHAIAYVLSVKQVDAINPYPVVHTPEDAHVFDRPGLYQWPLPNVWLGVSVETQYWADRRIPDLLETPAALRWISAEPLLSDLYLQPYLTPARQWSNYWLNNYPYNYPDHQLDWVVLGGESGPGARLMHYTWEQSIRQQCADAGVAYFRKQWGEWKPISAMLDWEHTTLYRSNRRARPHQDQDIVDDVSGKTCKVPTTVMHADGKRFDDPGDIRAYAGAHPMLMFKVGKKAAGDLLEGVRHQAWPAVINA